MMSCINLPGSQRGAALAVGMIMLLLLSVIGITSMQSSLMQERMTGNTRDLGYAFQSAELTLREGERWLNTVGIKPDEVATCSTDCNVSDIVWLDTVISENNLKNVNDWWNKSTGTSSSRTADSTPKNVSAAPRYIVEYRSFSRDSFTVGTGTISGRQVYDITARGTGMTDTSQVILRSRYAQRY